MTIGAGLRWLRSLVTPRGAPATSSLPRLRLPATAGERAKLRLLVFADAAGATLQINLLRPLRRALEAGACRLDIVTEADEAAWQRAGSLAPEAALDALWREAAPSAVFVSRYGGGLAAAIHAAARRHGTPLVYHLDDNLFAVPPDAGAAKAAKYGAPGRQAAMRLLLARAAVVYLSTARLQAQLAEAGLLPDGAARVFVGDIASASDPLDPAPRRSDPAGPVFGYMASSSHGPDLGLAMPGIVAALELDPRARFEIYGSLAMPPALAQRFGARVGHHAAVPDYDAFLSGLRDLAWDWGLAPLCQGRFNEAKTDTKWVEYAAAGIPCVASRHPVYDACLAAGAAVPAEDGGWAAALPAAVADPALRTRILGIARQRLLAEHPMTGMTGQLAEVLRRAGVPPGTAALATA